MWSDNETDIDLLQFRYIATSVTRLIKSKHLLPTTIGIFGDWGSGKSSLLKMVENEIISEKGMMSISFNGWLFEGFEDAKTALMGTILEQIQDRIKDDQNLMEKAGGLLTKLSKRVNWFHLLSLTGRYGMPALLGMPQLTAVNIGIDTVKTIAEKVKGIDPDEAKKLLKEAPGGQENIRRNIREFRSDFAKLLEKSEIGTLVVFVDDLDRCMPDTVIETLEAIKLFLFVPNTVFILGADERLIEYAVRHRFPELPGTDTEVGRDYLEKLIQIPIRIPQLSSAENHSYINLLFAQSNLDETDFSSICNSIAKFKPNNVSDLSFDITICREVLEKESITSQLEHDLDLTAQIAPVLASGLGGSPRRTKRFLNMMLLRMQMAEDRGLNLKRQILAKLMLLEYIRPIFFKQLAKIQADQEGKPEEIILTENVLQNLPKPKKEMDGNERKTEIKKNINKSEKNIKEEKKIKEDAIKSVNKESNMDILPVEIQPWAADSWMRKWLITEPNLSGIDLKSYFYIAHDSIGFIESSQTRLSPAAKIVLDKLLDPGSATQKIGLRMSGNLGNADATALFENLAERIRQSESLDKSPQNVLFDLMTEQPDLIPQLIALYTSLPETKITLSTAPTLFQIVKETSSMAAAKSLLERWSKSSNSQLAKAAEAVIRRIK